MQHFYISEIYRLMGGDGVPTGSVGTPLVQYAVGGEQPIDLDGLKGEVHALRKQIINEAIKQYDPLQHDVTNPRVRKAKPTFVPNGQKDPVTGEDKLELHMTHPARVPLQIQKYIIKQKASFARGNGVKLRPSDAESDVFKWVYKNWYENKTDYHLLELFTRLKSESQVAVVFFGDPTEAKRSKDPMRFRLRFKVLSPLKGSYLYPYFDPDTESLVALMREYEDASGNTVYDLYIDADPENGRPRPVLRRFYEDDLTRYSEMELPYPKLPVVYWGDDRPECADSEAAINELENGFSDFLTQMGYSADPILFGKGKTLTLPAKGSAGKFIEGSEDADLKYVTPDNATESRELQFKLLQKFIFSLNRAVILDLDTMKNLSDVSGAALDRYLIDAYLEARDNQTGPWGLGVQRMCNIQVAVAKDILGLTDDYTTVDVEFTQYRVNDVRETVDMLLMANGNLPLIDHQESITAAGLVDDPSVAFERIKQQEPRISRQTVEAEIAQQQAGEDEEDTIIE